MDRIYKNRRICSFAIVYSPYLGISSLYLPFFSLLLLQWQWIYYHPHVKLSFCGFFILSFFAFIFFLIPIWIKTQVLPINQERLLFLVGFFLFWGRWCYFIIPAWTFLKSRCWKRIVPEFTWVKLFSFISYHTITFYSRQCN